MKTTTTITSTTTTTTKLWDSVYSDTGIFVKIDALLVSQMHSTKAFVKRDSLCHRLISWTEQQHRRKNKTKNLTKNEQPKGSIEQRWALAMWVNLKTKDKTKNKKKKEKKKWKTTTLYVCFSSGIYLTTRKRFLPLPMGINLILFLLLWIRSLTFSNCPLAIELPLAFPTIHVHSVLLHSSSSSSPTFFPPFSSRPTNIFSWHTVYFQLTVFRIVWFSHVSETLNLAVVIGWDLLFCIILLFCSFVSMWVRDSFLRWERYRSR